MKILSRIFCALMIFVGFSLGSCVKSDDLTFSEVETIALKAWMEKNRPELLDNYQPQGGYYVELLDEGVADSLPLRQSNAWVWYDITCRDLAGNIVLTRNSELARMQSSYTEYTHYAPYFLYCGDENRTMIEGTYMALRNKLKIGDKEYLVRYGTKMRLYLPSSIVGGIYSDGGYEGQYSLDNNKPVIVDMEVMGHVVNPLAYEDQWIRSFAEANGGLAPNNDSSQKEENSFSQRYPLVQGATRGDESDKKEPILDDKWRLAVDSIAALYINYGYTPKQRLNFDCLGADTMMHKNQTVYNQGKIYGTKTLEVLNKEIDDILLERFGEGLDPKEAEPADSVSGLSIWYITRLMDGFIVDTNIAEVKRLIYNDPSIEDEDCKALDFDMDNQDNNNYVDAWKYAVPQLRVGSWNVILTGSSNAYGATGVSGSHSTTSSSTSNSNYYDYLNYYNYMNSYYGNGMYNDYYGGYYGGYGYGYGGYGGYGDYYNNYYYNSMYYNNYYNNSYTTDTTTSTTTTSEVPAYSPMLFQVFVLEADED